VALDSNCLYLQHRVWFMKKAVSTRTTPYG